MNTAESSQKTELKLDGNPSSEYNKRDYHAFR